MGHRPPDQNEAAGDYVSAFVFFKRQLSQHNKLSYGNALPGLQSIKIYAVGNKIAMLIVGIPRDPMRSLGVCAARNGLDRFADQIVYGDGQLQGFFDDEFDLSKIIHRIRFIAVQGDDVAGFVATHVGEKLKYAAGAVVNDEIVVGWINHDT